MALGMAVTRKGVTVLDLNSPIVEVRIREDGKVIRVNTAGGCQLRISGIGYLAIHDDRPKTELKSVL